MFTLRTRYVAIHLFKCPLISLQYPSSEAPPNHFDLPLGDNTIFTYPLPNTTTSSFYPGRQADHSGQHYPHYLPRRNYVVQYFRASSDITLPLASTAAKLLLVAYRELRPFVVPSHLPLNAEAARRRWWANIQDANVIANLVAQGMDQEQATVQVQAQAAHPDHLPPVPAHVTPPVDLGPTQEDYHRLNRDRAAVLPLGARWDWETGQPTAVNNEERENVNDNAIAEGESRRWDTLWWRMRLCGDYRNPQPSFAPGAVFDRGSMRGTWKGKIYVSISSSSCPLQWKADRSASLVSNSKCLIGHTLRSSVLLSSLRKVFFFYFDFAMPLVNFVDVALALCRCASRQHV